MRPSTLAATSFHSLLLVVLAFTPPVHARKYQVWFDWFDRSPDYILSSLTNGPCQNALNAYHLAFDSIGPPGLGKTQTCYAVQDCILSSFSESHKANYQAASVILGLLPQILAGLGPSISEVSLLSTTRPLLSFLISLGAPAVYPNRCFSFDDPKSLLHGRLKKQTTPPQPYGRAVLYSILEYALVIATIVNVFHTATILGQRTILTWSCRLDWGPVIWGLIPMTIHGVAALSYNLDLHRQAITRLEIQRIPTTSTALKPENQTPSKQQQQKPSTSIWYNREFTIIANQPRSSSNTTPKTKPAPTSVTVIFLNCLAGLMAFFHRWFGTLIFSSLNFISVYDILNYVYWRYMLSTLVCRLVLMFELAGLGQMERQMEQRVAQLQPVRSYTGMTLAEEIGDDDDTERML